VGEAELNRAIEEDIQKLFNNPFIDGVLATEREVLDRTDINRREEYLRFMKKAIIAHLSSAMGIENRTPEEYVNVVGILRKYMYRFCDMMTEKLGCLDYHQDAYFMVDTILSTTTPERLKEINKAIKDTQGRILDKYD